MSRKLRKYDQNLIRTGGRLAARVSEAVPFCWFCDATNGTRSKEHIFPRWLLAHYGAEKERVQPHRISMAMGGALASERPERPLIAHLNGEVCAACNNGWLSTLETQVQPILTSPVKRGRISPDEAQVLARWFAKVAVNLNVSQPYRLLVPAPDRHGLAHGIPNQFSADLFRVRKQNGIVDWVQGWMVGMLLPASIPTEQQKSLTERTLVTHIRIADLVGVVTLLPRPLDVRYLLPETSMSRIWPPPERLPTWGGLPRHDDYLSTTRFINYAGPHPLAIQ